jgi:hypothetical protein
MRDEVEQHIASVKSHYAPIIAGGNPRLEGGARLWRQFEDTVACYVRGKVSFGTVYERINELAVADILLADSSLLSCQIRYEPPITTNDRRIDFVVPMAAGSTLYIEVKTVRPSQGDTEKNWQNYERRRQHHTVNTNYIVDQKYRGAEIYSDSFASRSKFMEYTREFEARLADATGVQPGRGVLAFCGTGMEWHRSELEDFADFYRNGLHREDDPFAAMEAAQLQSVGEPLQRNIAAFCFLKRPMDSTTGKKWIADLRGPTRFS